MKDMWYLLNHLYDDFVFSHVKMEIKGRNQFVLRIDRLCGPDKETQNFLCRLCNK
jgi:hypothetical protein